MDKLREDFEADFENETGWSAGEYPSQEVADLCWRLYQQSRASIVVELPTKHDPADMFVSDAYDAEDVAAAIRSIGLTIKGE